MPLEPNEVKNAIALYLQEIDIAFDHLSQHEEGKIIKLPSFVYAKRQVYIFKLGTSQYFLVKAIVDDSLESDMFTHGQLNSNDEILKVSSPIHLDFDLNKVPKNYNILWQDFKVMITSGAVKDINALTVFDGAMLAIAHGDRFLTFFSDQVAKDFAFNYWNNISNNFDNQSSFIYNLRTIFIKLSYIQYLRQK